MRKRLFSIKTLGCKVNQYESQLMRESLLSCGWQETTDGQMPDIYIINTCTVTNKADKECRESVRHYIKENPRAVIFACGCYAETEAGSIRAIDKRIKILGNKEKLNLAEAASRKTIFDMFKRKGPLSHGITDFKAHDRAFIKIQDGCNNFCSYCIVPYARGRSRSRDPKEILAEAERLIDKGYKELVLTGICLGDFGKDLGSSTGLRGLISSISEIDGDFRIRLSSIELPDVTDDLIDEMASSKKLCNHLHIPLQSGDNEVLKNMNRRYAKEEFVKRIEYIRSRIPDIGITTDIIVGFPSETEEAFRNTIETIKKIRPSRAHIFRYSRRKKTRAFDMADNVSAAIKEARYKQLKELTDKFAEDFKAEAVKKPQRVLLESCRDKETGFLMGYTDTYVKVLLDGPDGLMGRFKNGPVPILVARV